MSKIASRLISRPVPDLQTHFQVKAFKDVEAIKCDLTHPLCKELQAITSAISGRLICFWAETNQFQSSFLLTAVLLSSVQASVATTSDLLVIGFYCSSCTVLPLFRFIASFTSNYLVEVILNLPHPLVIKDSLLCTCI